MKQLLACATICAVLALDAKAGAQAPSMALPSNDAGVDSSAALLPADVDAATDAAFAMRSAPPPASARVFSALQCGDRFEDVLGQGITLRVGCYNLFDADPSSVHGSAVAYGAGIRDPRGRMIDAKRSGGPRELSGSRPVARRGPIELEDDTTSREGEQCTA